MRADICGGCWSYLDEDGACPHCDHGEDPVCAYEPGEANEAAELAWEIRMENEYERSLWAKGEK